MDATLHALGNILLQALPTFFLVLLLFVYLRVMFFGPMGRILAQRHEATVGARQAAQKALDDAAAKAAAYEESIRQARNEVYKEQEDLRKKWRDEQSEQVVAARKRAEAQIVSAREQIAQETAQAKKDLGSNAQELATQITRSVLEGKAS